MNGGPDDDRGVLFLLDVDNTLLDNDRFQADLQARIGELFGEARREQFWALFKSIWAEGGFADYLAALQKFRLELLDDPRILDMSAWLLEYPFAERAFPGAFEAIAHCRRLGRAAVLSDGDAVLQPRKLQRSGIWDAVDGRVMIYIHKEQVMDRVQQRYAASHYVMVDDKPNLLATMKQKMGNLLTTVFVRQGQYGRAANAGTYEPKPDLVIDRIASLASFNLSDFKVAL